MKKITTIILAAALLAALSGCDKSGNSSDSESPSSTSTTSEAVESPSESTGSESSTESQVSTSTDGVKILSRICYMRPIYKSTLDDPDWKENTPGDGNERVDNWFGEKNFESKQFFDVKEGDKLENGLTVKKIVVYKNDDGSVKPEPEIRFEGELEMEGTLFLQQQDHDYFWTARELEFFPDSNKNPYIPMWFEGYNGDSDCERASLWGELVQADCTFQLGSIDNADIDEDEIFDGKIAVKVKLTVDNITVGNTGGLSYTNCEYCYGHIVSCERID